MSRAPGARVHAFEPLPPIFDAPKRNLETYAPSTAAYNVGLADCDAVFECDQNMTMALTMFRAR